MGLHMGKIIFVDVDGIIKDMGGEFSPLLAETIRKVRENGHEICLCTGRTYQQIDPDILNIGWDGVIANSGGYVEYKGECLKYRLFTQLAYIEFMNDLLKEPCVVEIETKNDVYVLRKDLREYLTLRVRLLDGKRRALKPPKNPIPVDTVLDVPEVEKLMVFGDKALGKEILDKWSYAFLVREARMSCAACWAGEITPKNINEVKGIRKILSVAEKKQKDVVVIGDGTEDLEMLQFAETGVALANAKDEVKAVSDYVTKAVLDEGIREAFVHLDLI